MIGKDWSHCNPGRHHVAPPGGGGGGGWSPLRLCGGPGEQHLGHRHDTNVHTPPRSKCQPVATTGSTSLANKRTITVPAAILWAAKSIHHSPLSQSGALVDTSVLLSRVVNESMGIWKQQDKGALTTGVTGDDSHASTH